MAERSLTRNAANPKDVKDAGRLERRRVEQWRIDLLATMGTPHGRALLWAVLRRANIFGSVFHRDAGVMAYNAGRQDFGHELMAEIIDAGPSLYLAMEREARERDTRDQGDEDAAHTPSAEGQE